MVRSDGFPPQTMGPLEPGCAGFAVSKCVRATLFAWKSLAAGASTSLITEEKHVAPLVLRKGERFGKPEHETFEAPPKTGVHANRTLACVRVSIRPRLCIPGGHPS